jgi:uncharacterized membrane protein
MLKQGGKFFNDYTDEFYQLVSKDDMVETEEQLVERYLNGLRQSLLDILCLQSLWTVSEVYQRALTVEKQQTTRNISISFGQNKLIENTVVT